MHVAGPGSKRCGFREAQGLMAGEAFLQPAAPEMGWEESLGFPQAETVVSVQPGTEKRQKVLARTTPERHVQLACTAGCVEGGTAVEGVDRGTPASSPPERVDS